MDIARVAVPDQHRSALFLEAGSGFKKSWIRIRIRIKDRIQKLKRLKIEPWRAVDAHKRGLEARNGALDGIYQWSQIPITLMRSRIRIRIRNKVKGWIRILIEVKS
jgi:hypothetical protein